MEVERVHNLDAVVVALHTAVVVGAGVAAGVAAAAAAVSAVVVDLGPRFRCSKNDWPSIRYLDHDSMLEWRTE